MYVYPTVKRVLPGGEQLAEKELSEHAEAERTMKTLEGLDAQDPQFEATLRTLLAQIREHIADEEGRLFPQLRGAMSEDELRELGSKIEAAKKVAPTRPHPAATDRPTSKLWACRPV